MAYSFQTQIHTFRSTVANSFFRDSHHSTTSCLDTIEELENQQNKRNVSFNAEN